MKRLFSIETRFTEHKPSISPEINESITWLTTTIVRLERQRDRAMNKLNFYRAGFWSIVYLGLVYLFVRFVLGLMEGW
ncbi:MAG TPA: hypothetical protein VJU84_08750 [Pyrinomonadaceae bacterium]|nr:hypothetical protein [Pyrinomonadaceae bacterium]